MDHLLAQCSFSRQIWHEVLAWCRLTVHIPTQDATFAGWWHATHSAIPHGLRKGFDSLAILTAWWLWKHRNDAIFNNQQPLARRLISAIQEEAKLWARAGAKGLMHIIPEE